MKLLGQAMRETEDEITRDMLAATAGFINCVGGVNGDNPRMCGVVKSLVIDLEPEVAFFANRQQGASVMAA